MNKDIHLISEQYSDNVLSKTKQAIGKSIMRMVKYRTPEPHEIPKVKEELINVFKQIKSAGDKPSEEQANHARELINQLRNVGLSEEELRNMYKRCDQKLPSSDDETTAQEYADEMQTDYKSQKIKPEDSEGIPHSAFIELMKHINKGPIKTKPHNELPLSHMYVKDLAKQDSRELYNNDSQEEEEKDEEGDLMAHMKQKGMIPSNSSTDTGKYGHSREEEEDANSGPGDVYDLGNNYKVRLDVIKEPDNIYYEIEVLGKNNESIALMTMSSQQGNIFKNLVSSQPQKALQILAKDFNIEFDHNNENEERRIDPKCWKGYHKSGTKLKDGVRVNNCVKNK